MWTSLHLHRWTWTQFLLFSSAFHFQQSMCDELLRSESWSSCSQRVNPQHYIQACVLDMCSCGGNSSDLCVCSTLSEFSRQCSHAGGQPPSWRNPQFCGNVCCFCQSPIRICALCALLGFNGTKGQRSARQPFVTLKHMYFKHIVGILNLLRYVFWIW